METLPTSQLHLVKRFLIRPRKRLGQHFIIKEEILDRIVELCHFQKNDVVVEIGAGLGGLTTRLAACAETVLAIEKDGELANLLKTKIIKQKNVTIVHQDALYFDYQLASSKGGRLLKVVGNLPYNIASLLTIELLKKKCIEAMFLMFQKEVAERITASPGTKEYGFLTIMANLYAEVAPLLFVGKEAFYPPPKVESALIHFKLLSQPREALKNETFFVMVVKSAFAQRRKKLRNALKTLKGADVPSSEIEKICSETGIDPNRRGETLTVKEFALLSNHLFSTLT